MNAFKLWLRKQYFNFRYNVGGYLFVLLVLVAMYLYCPWFKPYTEKLHHKVDSVLGIHEDEHKEPIMKPLKEPMVKK